MKKIFAIALVALSAIVLVACGKDKGFSLEITSSSELRESVVFEYKLDDKDNKLKDSDVKASISLKGSKSTVSTKTLSFDKEEVGSVTFTGLTSNTDYSVKFYAGYDGKNVTLVTKEVRTSNQGSEDNPYEISDSSQFSTLVKNDRFGYFKLVNDIDFKGSYVAPLYSSTTPFAGQFDGNNHKISNFVIGNKDDLKNVSSTSYMGLFGYITTTGSVKDLTLDKFELNMYRSSKTYYAILAGYNSGSISNVTITNSILNVSMTSTSLGYVGGLVAYNAVAGTIENCNVTATITGIAKRSLVVGGIVGTASSTNTKSMITDCNYNGDITVKITGTSSTAYTSSTSVGGVAGENFVTIKHCSSTGTINVDSKFKTPSTTEYAIRVGGLVGNNANDASVLLDSSSTMTMTIKSFDAKEIYAGALVGQNGGALEPIYASIENCTYTLPQGGKNLIQKYEAVVSNCGLVGVDKFDYSSKEKGYTTTAPFDFTVETYKSVTNEETKDTTDELDKTETFTVGANTPDSQTPENGE